MNIEKLQRFRHDSKGVHEDQKGDYLWYDDVVALIEEDRKERERCVEVLKSAIGLKVEGKRVSHPMDSLKSRLAELEGEKAKMVLDFAASIKHVVTSMLAHQRNSLQRNVRIAELTTENRKLREELEAYKKK